jgi:hypothetical protein
MRAAVLLIAFLVAVAFAAPFADVAVHGSIKNKEQRTSSLKGLTKSSLSKLFKAKALQGSETECKICIDFMNEAVQYLIEIIANGGVIGGCQALCNAALKNHSEILSVVCDLLCTVVGIDEFEKLLSDADPDPVWLCEEVKACDYDDSDSANVTSLSVQPESGRTGTKFDFDISYELITWNGIGSVGVVVFGPGAVADGGGLLYYPQPGSYSGQFQLDTRPDQYNSWAPGSYEFQIAVCEGDCGCTHDHNKVVATSALNFTITA